MSRKSKCDERIYSAFIESTEKRYSCLALSQVSPVKFSHDSASRWLKKKKLTPSILWGSAKNMITTENQHMLIFDDTILDKSRSKKIGLIKSQYSGCKHGLVVGISVVNCINYDMNKKESVPVDFRIYAKEEDGKTKNEHFREMINLSKKRSMNVDIVTMDSWYSSLDNLKTLKNVGYNWLCGFKKNRIVNNKTKLQDLDIPNKGLVVYLRGYGWVKVFRFEAQNGYTKYYGTNILDCSTEDATGYVNKRWNIETYHRELKQTCGIERCQARTCRSQRNHILLSIMAWIHQRLRRGLDTTTIYQQKWNVLKDAIRENMRMLLCDRKTAA